MVFNPFLHDMVQSPWDKPEADVPAINKEVFDEAVRLFGRVVDGNRESLVITGDPGSGKTHLLARFREYVESAESPASERLRGLFIAVRLNCPASHVWRHLRKCFFHDLLRPRNDGTTALEMALNRLNEQKPAGLEGALDAAQVELNLAKVLEHYHACRYRRECRSWLQGHPLTDRDLERLDLATDDSRLEEEDSQEVRARDRIMQVARLMAPTPVVFSFDQVEALEAYPDDQRGIAAFSLMAADVAELANAFTLLSMQSSFQPRFQKVAHQHEWDRVARQSLGLRNLTLAEGISLLAKRIEAVPDLREKYPHQPLGPLEHRDLEGFFKKGHGTRTARELLHFAKDRFEPGPPIGRSQFFQQQLEERWQDSPAFKGSGETDEIVLHGLQLVSGLAGARAGDPPERFRRDISLQMGPDHAPVYLVMLNQQHGLAVTNRLKRLKNALAPAERARLRLIRDSRLQIAPTAKKGLRLLNEMEQEGARLVQPGAETLAALDAVRSLLADAQSGDLAREGRTVAPESVREWLAEKLPDAVRDLIEQISGEGEPAPVELLEFVQQRRVVPVWEAAERLGMAEERVIKHARHNPDAVRVLAGPPPVLFYYVPAAVGGELAET